MEPYHTISGMTEAGVDEAGRGCLAGPVYAAAVILPIGFYHPMLDDSKKVNEKDRDTLRKYIEENAIAFGVASIGNEEIDSLNILKATFKAMHLAIDKLMPKPKLLLIDGNRFAPYPNTTHRCVVKGDSIHPNIAAASILAKTYRDDFIKGLHDSFPRYGWYHNKGYGTLDHRKAIEDFGLSIHHRKTFRLKSLQTSNLYG